MVPFFCVCVITNVDCEFISTNRMNYVAMMMNDV